MLNRTRAASFVLMLGLGAALTACPPGGGVTPIVTDVGKSVATLQTTVLLRPNLQCAPGIPPEPDVTAWWNGLPPSNKQYPFAGFEVWTPTNNCQQSRLDFYRALVTFNIASVSNLKGLVTKAELLVSTRALPDSAGRLVSIGPLGTTSQVNAVCPSMLGGGSLLQRIAPAATGNLPPVSGTGMLHQMNTAGLIMPLGQTMYQFPATFAAGPVAGATLPTTLSPIGGGNGGSVFITDVTNSVNAALNGNFAGMSYMLTSNFEGPLNFMVPVGHNIECKTSYDIRLRLTHL